MDETTGFEGQTAPEGGGPGPEAERQDAAATSGITERAVVFDGDLGDAAAPSIPDDEACDDGRSAQPVPEDV